MKIDHYNFTVLKHVTNEVNVVLAEATWQPEPGPLDPVHGCHSN